MPSIRQMEGAGEPLGSCIGMAGATNRTAEFCQSEGGSCLQDRRHGCGQGADHATIQIGVEALAEGSQIHIELTCSETTVGFVGLFLQQGCDILQRHGSDLLMF